MEKNSSVGFLGLLQIAFIVLKLCHVIDWSWSIVLIPTWCGILLFVIVILLWFWTL